MGHSSLTGLDPAPIEPPGHDVDLLGPSDSSDSGSDSVGSPESDADTDAAGTGERRSAAHDNELREGADIGVDRVFSAGTAADGDVDDSAQAGEGDEDEDPDLAFIDRARADDAQDDETAEDEGQDVEDETPAASQDRRPAASSRP